MSILWCHKHANGYNMAHSCISPSLLKIKPINSRSLKSIKVSFWCKFPVVNKTMFTKLLKINHISTPLSSKNTLSILANKTQKTSCLLAAKVINGREFSGLPSSALNYSRLFVFNKKALSNQFYISYIELHMDKWRMIFWKNNNFMS